MMTRTEAATPSGGPLPPRQDPAGEDWVVVFSGGGTGGHLYPALALAAALRRLRPDARAFFVGARRGVEARILPERGEEHLLVGVEGFRRGTVTGNLRVVSNLLQALVLTGRALHRLRPRAVVVTGGYAGGPAGVMAVLMRIRLVLQEQNAVPGITTRALSLFARDVHVAFPEAVDHLPRRARSRVRLTGNPVVPPSPPPDRAAAMRALGLDPHLPLVLVVGGSQGSLAPTPAVLEALTAVMSGLPPEARPTPPLQILWSTGPTHLARVREGLRELGEPAWVHPTGYIDEMPRALGVSDIAVSRAGAMATSEFLAWGIPAILVPLPTAAADHQTRNARALHEAGAAILLPEADLEGRVLWAWIARLAGDRAARRRMGDAALRRGRPDAAREIASSLAGLLPPERRGARHA
jgi:UDP-N-acetylglucosamine--N-acetylmuramyl-(pentapeptide) pyrophosphoryl-undecaprenol N-acetylglucosamine transferase